MKITVFTSARDTYDPPFADIIEFAVEKGFAVSKPDAGRFDPDDGTEIPEREEVPDPWFSNGMF